MTDPIARLATLSRPNLLVRAARFGMRDFNRTRSLRRLMPGETPPAPGQAFEALLEREAMMDEARRAGGAGYSPARHIEVLAALINEAQIAGHRLAA